MVSKLVNACHRIMPVQWEVILQLFFQKSKAESKARPYSLYGYPDPDEAISRSERPEYEFIMDWVEANSSILDLGCGDGSLGEKLIREKGCEVWGIEIDANGVKQALRKGVKAELGNMDEGLNFPAKSFDYVIINVTIQMVYRPDRVLDEALRVGKRVIISFPNFGHIFARLEMLFLGRFPQSTLFGYQWFNTRHIHSLSYKDFIAYLERTRCARVKVTKREFLWLLDTNRKYFLSSLFPDLFAGTCIFMLEE